MMDIYSLVSEFLKINVDNCVNAILVYYDARLTTLYESSNWHLRTFNERVQHMNFIKDNFLDKLSLIIIEDKLAYDEYPRWFVVKEKNSLLFNKKLTHKDVGFLLGMHCYNHINFANDNVDRYGGHIYVGNVNIYTEVANPIEYKFDLHDFEKSLQDKVTKWNLYLRIFNLECHYKIKSSYGYITLMNNIDDLDFVYHNIDEYYDLIYNYGDYDETMTYEQVIEQCKLLKFD